MSRTGPPPNYYKILEVSESANATQIRTAYKKAALKFHPDRLDASASKSERERTTRRFQLINDAYYTLSDANRRREYDAQRRLFGYSSGGGGKPAGDSNSDDGGATYTDPFEEFENTDGAVPPGGPGNGGASEFFSWAWNFFMNNANSQQQQEARQEAENEQFGDVFEEMLREENLDEAGQPKGKMWSLAGGAAGGVLGFIAANVPGAVAGAVAGNRLGAIRDAKKKSVYDAFLDLPSNDRHALLVQLFAKVVGHVAGGSGIPR